MTSTTKRAKCLSGSHSFTDGGRRYAVSRSIVRKLLKSAHPETKKGRINVSILPDAAQCAKSDRLLGEPDSRSLSPEPPDRLSLRLRGERFERFNLIPARHPRRGFFIWVRLFAPYGTEKV